jgi:hypothetical protein
MAPVPRGEGGLPGQENHSNTRRAWLLVRGGYVEPDKFLCPGRREEHPVDFNGFRIRDFNDFPSRAYIHFSVRIGCPAARERGLMQKCVLMADRNPLSEGLPSDYTSVLNLSLVQKLMTSNSKNHAYRGQSALLYDGSVEFVKGRHTSVSRTTLRGGACALLKSRLQFHHFRPGHLPRPVTYSLSPQNRRAPGPSAPWPSPDRKTVRLSGRGARDEQSHFAAPRLSTASSIMAPVRCGFVFSWTDRRCWSR